MGKRKLALVMAAAMVFTACPGSSLTGYAIEIEEQEIPDEGINIEEEEIPAEGIDEAEEEEVLQEVTEFESVEENVSEENDAGDNAVEDEPESMTFDEGENEEDTEILIEPLETDEVELSDLAAEEAALYAYDAETPSENFEYEIVDGEVTITGYIGDDSAVVLPSKIEGYPVTKIGSMAFWNCERLTSITIPDSVTSIDNWAFYGCSSLMSITIPGSVTSIGGQAFEDCSSLTSITIPDSVTSIESRVFDGCSSLTGITIPDSVTSIGDGAFSRCSSLMSITIPNSVTSIGDGAFSWCSSLTSIAVDSSNAVFSSRDGVLFNKTKLICYPAGKKEGAYNIPSGVASIGNAAFSDCSSLKSITIPNSVTSIGDNAFDGCSSLTGITIPNGVTSIGYGAFDGCSSLRSIVIPNSVTRIDAGTFYNCSSLASVTIPNSVTSIWEDAFRNCKNLTSITIPNSVMIGNGAFGNCSGLTSVTISGGMMSIGCGAFEKCKNLTSITIPNSVTDIEWGAFYGCSSLKDIYYSGTEEEWNKIYVEEDNDELTGATIHFNSVGVHTHVWKNWVTVNNATVFLAEKQKRSCTVCGKEEERSVGKKLTPTVKVNATKIPLKVKQSTTKLKVDGLAAGDSIVSWKSSNTKIVKVNNKGKLTAQKKTGKATITVTLASGLVKKISVTVQKGAVKTSKISNVPKKLSMKKGEKMTLAPSVTPITTADKVKYSTSNKKVATVNAKGKIVAKKKGTAVITVKSGGVKTTCKVTVK